MKPAVNGSLVMLVAEDNPADVFFFREALGATRTAATLHVVENGGDAMRFLLRQQPYDDAPRPDVVVLDLNLPIKTGQEVLMEMAGDPALNTIPVAILTTSTPEKSVSDMYAEGLCLSFAKTDDFRHLQDIVEKIAAHAKTAQISA